MSSFDFDVIGDPLPARRKLPPGPEPAAAAELQAKPASPTVPQPPDRVATRRPVEVD